MTKRDSGRPGDATRVDAALRAAYRRIEAEPAPERLQAHLDALAPAARKDRRA
jgi:hypothetical protein